MQNSLYTPEEAGRAAVSKFTPQINDALASGQRRISVPMSCANAVSRALAEKGWGVVPDPEPDGGHVTLVLISPIESYGAISVPHDPVSMG